MPTAFDGIPAQLSFPAIKMTGFRVSHAYGIYRNGNLHSIAIDQIMVLQSDICHAYGINFSQSRRDAPYPCQRF